MQKEFRTIVYDEELRLEAYHLIGIAKAFPKHFHEYYVLGLVEAGTRRLFCSGSGDIAKYTLGRGDMILFNPGDNHACVQLGAEELVYRGINIAPDTMLAWAAEVTGRKEPPSFKQNVVCDEEISAYFLALHKMIMQGDGSLGKEEIWLFMLNALLQKYAKAFAASVPDCRQEVERACAFMERHFAERISLEQICREAGLSKSALLRAFAKAKGLTPYRYLESVRIGEAKKLLCQGITPLQAAMRTGFADQSHFTNYFRSFTGLTPGAYREIFAQQAAKEEKEE